MIIDEENYPGPGGLMHWYEWNYPGVNLCEATFEDHVCAMDYHSDGLHWCSTPDGQKCKEWRMDDC